MFRYIMSLTLMLSGCSDANFGGSGAKADAKKPPGTTSGNPDGSTSGTPDGSTSGNPGGGSTGGSSTGGLNTDDGGKSVQSVILGAGMTFDGVTNIDLNLQTGQISYNNNATIASGKLVYLKINLKDANGNSTPLQVPLGGSAQIPNWRPAKSANLTGQENYTRNSTQSGAAPFVSAPPAIGGIFHITIDDDRGTRPGSVTFPNLDLGLQY